MSQRLPVIDVSPLLSGSEAARRAVADEIGAACCDLGFFYAAGHAIAPATLDQLSRAAHDFFALPETEKMKIAMAKGGRAWRGFFPVGGELTSGKPDIKRVSISARSWALMIRA
ncbi:MAG: 2-oxoglutarate and iron-dependent oxygenase domain-containing protein [Hyphomonadaceae bacterium]